MTITRQKVQSVLRKAGWSRAEFSRSGQVRGWGSWSSGTEVKEQDGRIYVSYNFGSRRESDEVRIKRLKELQDVLLAAGIDCYPNSQETALIVGDSNA